MESTENIKLKLQNMLGRKRYNHCLNVAETASELAAVYHCSIEKAYIAGLIHDCAKEMKSEESVKLLKKNNAQIDKISSILFWNSKLIHAWVGVVVARRDFKIYDCEILDAIRYHTTAKENMPILTKIIYVADAIEPNRKYLVAENARKIAFQDLDKATTYILSQTISALISRNSIVHPDTFNARNYLIMNEKKNKI